MHALLELFLAWRMLTLPPHSRTPTLPSLALDHTASLIQKLKTHYLMPRHTRDSKAMHGTLLAFVCKVRGSLQGQEQPAC